MENLELEPLNPIIPRCCKHEPSILGHKGAINPDLLNAVAFSCRLPSHHHEFIRNADVPVTEICCFS